jgi:hypothetical protein
LTPAASTLIRISFAPGVGTGISTGLRTSGPPGSLMDIAVIAFGRVVMSPSLDVGSDGWKSLVHAAPRKSPLLQIDDPNRGSGAMLHDVNSRVAVQCDEQA